MFHDFIIVIFTVLTISASVNEGSDLNCYFAPTITSQIVPIILRVASLNKMLTRVKDICYASNYFVQGC